MRIARYTFGIWANLLFGRADKIEYVSKTRPKGWS